MNLSVTRQWHSFFQQQRTGTLLRFLRDISASADRKALLALCYELRQRGYDV